MEKQSLILLLKTIEGTLPDRHGPWKRPARLPQAHAYIAPDGFIPPEAWSKIIAARRLINEAIETIDPKNTAQL